jgi:DNA-binding transcriptional regulator GbsR (MarR family)
MKLEPPIQKFIVHWGEMGTKWGINRSVAQIHALLYIMGCPVAADEIAETLDIARSNVSGGLKELQGWGLVKIAHQLGDRRDHFETSTDVWEAFRVILRERKRREIEPTIQVLRDCTTVAKAPNSKVPAEASERLGSMLEFLELVDSWGDRAIKLSPQNLRRISKLSDSIFSLVE